MQNDGLIKVFQRVEKKYVLTKEEYLKLMKQINKYIKPDLYPTSKIYNIYFDTDNYMLINKSIEKPVYKEKVRLRSYGVPSVNDDVFLEIKKKYNSIVSKRRIVVNLKDFYNYINKDKKLDKNSQVFKELDYCFKLYNLKSKVFIAYDRESYVSTYDNEFRITFDKNLRYRLDDLKLENGDMDDDFLDNNYIMEIKTQKAIPLWFTKILSEDKIYPTSFSKYGEIYTKKIRSVD